MTTDQMQKLVSEAAKDGMNDAKFIDGRLYVPYTNIQDVVTKLLLSLI